MKLTAALTAAGLVLSSGLYSCTLVPASDLGDISIVDANGNPVTSLPGGTPTPTPGQSLADATKARLKVAAGAASPATLYDGQYSLNIVRAASNADSPISGRKLIPWNDTRIRYVGKMEQSRQDYPWLLTGTNRSVNYGSLGRYSNQYTYEFRTDAPTLEISYIGEPNQTRHRVMVDGKYLRLDMLEGGSDGFDYETRISFPNAKLRTIRIETNAMSLFGVYIGAKDTILAPAVPSSAPVRAVIMGDSFTQDAAGVAGVNDFEVYAARTARALGWSEYHQSGVGSTGYLAAPNGTLNFRGRLDSDVVPYNPEVLIIAGGINDPFEGLQSEASALFDEIRAKLPNTIVFVVGPWTSFGDQNAKAQSIRAAVANRANFYYIDNSDWIWGGGNVAQPTGRGNADLWVGADGAHMTQVGHNGVSAYLVDAIKRIYGTW
ncbi:SGNH/GDSL hydrolase family protein [Sphingomonas melonis]